MKEFRPLFETLEFRVTIDRVCRSLGFIFQDEDKKIANKQIRTLYKDLTNERPLIVKSDKYTYSVYPVEFIPVMINVVLEIKNNGAIRL